MTTQIFNLDVLRIPCLRSITYLSLKRISKKYYFILNMKKILIVVFLFFLSILKPGIKAQVTQEWLQIYSPTPRSNNNADKSAMDKFGNFIVAGRSEITDTSSTDLIILKYSSSGNLLWESRYNGPANNTETFKDMVLDDSCNIYVTCSSFEGAALGNINWVTLKYSPNGVLPWNQS